jgi:hypothetical protein
LQRQQAIGAGQVTVEDRKKQGAPQRLLMILDVP